MREYEEMLCVCFLKLDALLCLDHSCSAPLYVPSPSLLASLFPSHPSASGAKPRARAVARAGPLAEHWLWCLLRLFVVLVLCSGPGPCSCSGLNLWLTLKVSATIFRPFCRPNSLPSQPVAFAADPCQPMAIAARPH